MKIQKPVQRAAVVRPEKLAIGVDFGGTEIKLGLVNAAGRVLRIRRIPTRQAATQSAWLAAIEAAVAELTPAGRSLAGVGVGVPGFVDFERGFIHQLTNVRGWHRVPLAARLKARLRLPVTVDNDVNAMAVGECAFGAGRPYRHAVFVTLGTGVGGGLVLDGRLYRGAHSMAGEVGHIPILMNGRKTPEGRGGLEAYVGNRRIVARTVAALKAGRRSALGRLVKGDWRRVTPKLIAEAAQRGDALGRETFDFVADCLATAFAGVTYVLQPDVFIVGGGVAQSGAILFGPLRRHLRERLSPAFARRIRVIPARLGEAAGIIGCAALAFRKKAESGK